MLEGGLTRVRGIARSVTCPNRGEMHTVSEDLTGPGCPHQVPVQNLQSGLRRVHTTTAVNETVDSGFAPPLQRNPWPC